MSVARKNLNAIGSKICCHRSKTPSTIWNLTAGADPIKFVWVAGQRRNMQVLTILDVYSHWNISHYISYSINYQNVIDLFERVFEHLIIPEKMYVRCDNGAQFIAEMVPDWMVQTYFKGKQIIQEFIKPATPEQNSHIESYHSIMEIGPPMRRCLSEI